VLASLAGRALDLPPDHHVDVSIAGAPVSVIRRSETGSDGFQCWAMAFHSGALWQALLEGRAQPVGWNALDVLRVEAGIPWYGRDVDETVILPETRLERLVSYNKGCYLGQEVVARVKYRGHVNRALCGLVIDGPDVPNAGASVVASDREVGRITSAVRSIGLDRPIALGYVRREHFAPGSEVAVKDGERLVPARVSDLPFGSPASPTGTP
jgi:folate-binding protein YgfZ